MRDARMIHMIKFFVGCCCLCAVAGVAAAARDFDGRVVDGRNGAPVAGAEVTIVGQTMAMRTDADGRFSWQPDPRPPFIVIIVLPDGRVAAPITVDRLDPAAVLTLTVQSAVEESVTVAAGVAPSIDATPAAGMTLVSGREIALRAPGNLTQALENVPGVHQVSEGHAAVPAVRGLSGGRTLILLDGARVTSERRVGPSATYLDPGSVAGVDVARGPGSVAYGSDAFGGVISVRTRRPDHQAPLRMQVTGGLGAGVPEQRGQFEISRGFGNGGVLAQVRLRNADDYDGPTGAIFNSGWRDYGLLLRVERQIGGGVFSVGLQSDLARNVERPRDNSRDVRFYYPFEDSHRFTASYERPNVGALGTVKITGLLGRYSLRTDQDQFAAAEQPREIERADVSANDFQLRATAERAIGSTAVEYGVDVNGRFGLEAHDIIARFDSAETVVETLDTLSIDSARRTDTGFFLQATRPISPVVSASGGLRVDVVRNVNRGGFFGDHSLTNAAMAGFGAVTVGPFNGTTLTGQISRGFRDPTISDRFFRGPTGRGFITGNPDLDPEQSLQVDVAVRYAKSRVRLATYGYYYRITDLVERFEADPDFFFFRNRGRARLVGLELEAQADLGGGYAVELAGQTARGRALDDDGALADIATPSLSAVFRKSVADRWTSYARLAWYAQDTRPGPGEVVAPGYVDLSAGLGWQVAPELELRLSARNLLNDTYYASPSRRFVLAPGRSVSVTAVVTVQ